MFEMGFFGAKPSSELKLSLKFYRGSRLSFLNGSYATVC